MSASWRDLRYARHRVQAETIGPSRLAYVVVVLVAAFFVIAVLWAKYTVIDEVTRGEGRVIPSSKIQVIQNLEGGIVKEMLVQPGELVEPGQVLMRLAAVGFGSDLGELEARRRTLTARIARLTAEAVGTELRMPAELAAQDPNGVRAERELMRSRRESLEIQISILEDQVAQRRQELLELEHKVEQARESLSLINEEISITRPLVNSGVVPRIDLLRLRREANDLEGEIEASELAIPRAEAAMKEASQRIEEKYLAFRTEAQTELNEARAELASVQERLTAAQDRVQRTEIRSPVRGVVKTLHVRTIGGVIRPGMDIMEIVPVDDTLLVEARIRPSDIGFLRPGLEAMIKFTAYDFSIYGGLRGTLESISADSIVDEKTDESYFLVTLRTDENKLTRKGEELPLMPGMVASVDILTGKRSILDYLLKPILKTQSRALTER
ncbi:HlyD family type I secretion periplasmic adaptor subunit [Rhodospira trueperi]|uniref:Membrane fusion protein (MFP) family protein n=1 Tax=Rhodospira trueperi TaxID=69960 RepID=A0A1G7FUC8_9PROT|nr:HlyD family type I secretion periplasmic adaptor subunit [Rhodospira trueperi]SDE79335.1 membrane fusion protein, adhesin transport system [Rhodospira trueperi]